MQPRLLLAAAALLTLAACTDTPTAPQQLAPTARASSMEPNPDGTCNSGYHIATRTDGTTYCEE
jgi:hypothetical protein